MSIRYAVHVHSLQGSRNDSNSEPGSHEAKRRCDTRGFLCARTEARRMACRNRRLIKGRYTLHRAYPSPHGAGRQGANPCRLAEQLRVCAFTCRSKIVGGALEYELRRRVEHWSSLRAAPAAGLAFWVASFQSPSCPSRVKDWDYLTRSGPESVKARCWAVSVGSWQILLQSVLLRSAKRDSPALRQSGGGER